MPLKEHIEDSRRLSDQPNAPALRQHGRSGFSIQLTPASRLPIGNTHCYFQFGLLSKIISDVPKTKPDSNSGCLGHDKGRFN